ncbi:MAG TPA: hypothetical protein PKU82_04485 [Bacteroidia bacterium]|nr:hypothetical protein [Bacteroidia bacterium]HOZ90855.1 hypothetical protein [Bacteroidia bacterium]HRB52044.1 hypothetical protein [Bacteroidia bacterium]
MTTDVTAYDNCISTYSGLRFDFINPRPDMVNVLDICKGLANKPHFSGQTPEFFSIAEHCILVESLLPYDAEPEERLCALIHDGSEAYLPDMIKPIKLLLPLFKDIEDGVQSCIFDYFGLDERYMKRIKKYDIMAQQIEYNVFYFNHATLANNYHICYLKPKDAYLAYIKRLFYILQTIKYDSNGTKKKYSIIQ